MLISTFQKYKYIHSIETIFYDFRTVYLYLSKKATVEHVKNIVLRLYFEKRLIQYHLKPTPLIGDSWGSVNKMNNTTTLKSILLYG